MDFGTASTRAYDPRGQGIAQRCYEVLDASASVMIPLPKLRDGAGALPRGRLLHRAQLYPNVRTSIPASSSSARWVCRRRCSRRSLPWRALVGWVRSLERHDRRSGTRIFRPAPALNTGPVERALVPVLSAPNIAAVRVSCRSSGGPLAAGRWTRSRCVLPTKANGPSTCDHSSIKRLRRSEIRRLKVPSVNRA